VKVLKVYDGDFAVIHFENEHGGISVDEIIENPAKFLPTEENDEYEQWNLKVLEFEGTIDPNFISFIRDELISYDDSKIATFYIEGETVR